MVNCSENENYSEFQFTLTNVLKSLLLLIIWVNQTIVCISKSQRYTSTNMKICQYRVFVFLDSRPRYLPRIHKKKLRTDNHIIEFHKALSIWIQWLFSRAKCMQKMSRWRTSFFHLNSQKYVGEGLTCYQRMMVILTSDGKEGSGEAMIEKTKNKILRNDC